MSLRGCPDYLRVRPARRRLQALVREFRNPSTIALFAATNPGPRQFHIPLREHLSPGIQCPHGVALSGAVISVLNCQVRSSTSLPKYGLYCVPATGVPGVTGEAVAA